MSGVEKIDETSFAPFVLVDTGDEASLCLYDDDMISKLPLFEERSEEGWCGNGYDWESIALVLVAERFPALRDDLVFDPEAGMLSVIGPRQSLEKLGAAMRALFHDENAIRDILSRAEPG